MDANNRKTSVPPVPPFHPRRCARLTEPVGGCARACGRECPGAFTPWATPLMVRDLKHFVRPPCTTRPPLPDDWQLPHRKPSQLIPPSSFIPKD